MKTNTRPALSARTPTDHWGLRETWRGEVNDVEYVVYSDDDGVWAVEAYGFDTETPETDYSMWCSGEGTGVGQTSLCRMIAIAARLDGINASGAGRWVPTAPTM